MDRAQLNEFTERARAQAFEHILPFWCGPAIDHEQGGWLPWMSNDLQIDRSQPKGLIVNSRILWAFSAAYRVRPQATYRQMAQRALDYLMEHFWDTEFGGAYWRLDSCGKTLDTTKKIYGQAFYIYALTEYWLGFSNEPINAPGHLKPDSAAKQLEALDRAKRLFELVEEHAWDEKHGGYFEVCQRDWSEASDSRLSDKDMNEKKSMNNHLHVLEAYTNLYRLWKNPGLETRLRDLIGLFETRIVDGGTFHFRHFFDEQWQVRSNTYTFGHDIEGSWLLCEAAEVLGDNLLLTRIRKLALAIAETVLTEAVDVDGGIGYEGKGGRVIDRRKECWPQAEAVVGFINAYELSGQEKYLEAARRAWNYIEDNLVDRAQGEWYWRINLDGRPDPTLPKVSEWKGPYHGTRACLETIRRLQQIAS